MVKKETILAIMLQEHKKINLFFQKYKKSKDIKDWEIFIKKEQEHINLEEEVILVLYERSKDFAVYAKIISQHEKISSFIDKDPIDQNTLNQLEILMQNHVDLEEEKFYPALDSNLEDDEKEILIKRIHARINLNN